MVSYGPFKGTLQDDAGNRLVIGQSGAELVLASTPTPTPDPAPDPTPVPSSTRRSGLAWASGVFANEPTMPGRFATMRGRPVDLADVHCDAADVGNPYWLRSYTPATVGSLVLSCPLTAAQPPAAFEAAGKAMAARGFRGALARLRPGVEMNLANESRATDATVDAWVARFRVAANAFRKGAGSGAIVCVCVNEGAGSGLIHAEQLQRLVDELLRDGTADELGVDFYDQWPPMRTATEFSQRVDGEFGSLGWWADFAEHLGAQISVPEWGVARTDGGQWAGHAGGDNPAFVQAMVEWFRANAERLGYESYFAEPASYIASDLVTQMPKSRAAYVAGLK